MVPEFEQAARAGVDKPIVLMALRVTGSADQTADAAAEIRKNADILEGDDAVVPIHLVGLQALWAGMQDLSKEDLEKAEGIGFPIVFIVLLLIFGSVAAALLPLSLGFIAVAITGAIVYFLAQAIQMSIFVTNISSMLGIGVAVDYSLFVLARYREEIKRGASEDVARTAAMRTSGLAVAFSGVTVIIALAGLFLIDSKTAHSMAIGAIVVVAVAVLAAVTLLPALIATLGRRAYEPGKVVGKVVAKLSRKPKPEAVPFWTRWTNRLMNRPVLYASAATAADAPDRVPGAVDEAGHRRHRPAARATSRPPRASSSPRRPPARARVARSRSSSTTATAPSTPPSSQQFSAAVKGLPGVAAVAEPVTSSDGRMALIEVTSKTNPERRRHLRARRADPRARAGHAAGARRSASAAPRRRTTTSRT